MKIFKVNQESINKGIINKYFGFDIVTTELVAEVIKRTNLIKIDNIIFKLDNRIKGFCLNEYE
ncbi:hypothetical protein [Spiroplasma endosymbiont of Dasysyrphus albostriatus]|uniref:hypothetical protein n=1 Tax=Spiroplasma endosymbiont of Dasysyrphus albostriatus TaxID=3066299 RepID=UPI0030D3A79B